MVRQRCIVEGVREMQSRGFLRDERAIIVLNAISRWHSLGRCAYRTLRKKFGASSPENANNQDAKSKQPHIIRHLCKVQTYKCTVHHSKLYVGPL